MNTFISSKLIVSLLLVITSFLYPLNVSGQTGLIKTKSGFLAFAHSNNLSFTIHWDDEYGKLPEWIDNNRLDIFKDQFVLNFFEAESILSEYPDSKNPLSALKKWETDYIETTMPPNIDRSPFFQDTLPLREMKSAEFDVNRWYYSVNLVKGGQLYFYFFDIYKDNTFIRLSFIGNLEDARILTKSIFTSFNFYPDKIDIELLRNSIINGKYRY